MVRKTSHNPHYHRVIFDYVILSCTYYVLWVYDKQKLDSKYHSVDLDAGHSGYTFSVYDDELAVYW